MKLLEMGTNSTYTKILKFRRRDATSALLPKSWQQKYFRKKCASSNLIFTESLSMMCFAYRKSFYNSLQFKYPHTTTTYSTFLRTLQKKCWKIAPPSHGVKVKKDAQLFTIALHFLWWQLVSQTARSWRGGVTREKAAQLFWREIFAFAPLLNTNTRFEKVITRSRTSHCVPAGKRKY